MASDNTSEVFHDAVQAVPIEGSEVNPKSNDGDNSSVFHDAQTDLLPDDGHYFNHSDSLEGISFIG
jgi:hypothetical protein